MENLGFACRGVGEMRMRRTQLARELVQRVVSDENTGRDIYLAIVGVEFLDCRAAPGGVAFAEDFLKVTVQ
jgi:hypothetical protein